MKNAKNSQLLLLLALFAACQAAPAPVATPVRQLDLGALDAEVRRAMAVMDVPGLALAVVDRQGVVVAKGYGVRALGSDALVDADTLFDIGSITKTFTATAVATVVDEGTLSWETTIAPHVPGFELDDPWVTQQFTLADALSHRGGYLDVEYYGLRPDMSREELLVRLRHVQRVAPFRTAFEYHNVLFALAAFVMEDVTHERWAELVDARVLQPLGMTATRTQRDGIPASANRAAPHELTQDGMVLLPPSPWRDLDPIPAAGAILSSANDMAKWCLFQLHAGEPGVVPGLSPDTLRAMRTSHVSGVFDWFPKWGYGRQRAGYGLGWMVLDYRDDADQHVAHGGATAGMQAWMVVSPKHGYGIAMMTNAGWAGDCVHFAIANWIHDRVLGLPTIDWTGDQLVPFRGAYEKWLREREPQLPRDTSVPPSLPLARYAGSYDEPLLGPMVITLDGPALTVQLGIAKATAEHWGGDVFRIDWHDPNIWNGFITFDLDAAGVVKGLTFDDSMKSKFSRRADGR